MNTKEVLSKGKSSLKRGREIAKFHIKERAFDALLWLTGLSIERVISNIGVVYPENYAQKLHGALERGELIFIVANHQSHADGLPLAQITQATTTHINQDPTHDFQGFLVPVATTLSDGRQGQSLKAAFDKYASLFRRYSLFPRLYERAVDGRANNTAILRSLVDAKKNNQGVAIFPEGTVQGGRTTNGRINGIQPQGEKNLARLVQAIDNGESRTVLYIPVSLDGAYKIYNPDKKYISFREVLRLFNPKRQAAELTAKVHTPISSVELRSIAKNKGFEGEQYSQFASRYIFDRINEGLSEDARMRYRRVT